MDELKPCPFCGGKAELNRINHIDNWMYEVRCIECGCGTDYAKTSDVVIADWNYRKEKGEIQNG